MLGETLQTIVDGLLNEHKFYKDNLGVHIDEVAEIIAQIIKIDRIINKKEQLDYGMRFDIAREMLNNASGEP